MAKSRLKGIRQRMGGETTLEGVIGAMGREREEQVLRRIASFGGQIVIMVEKLQVAVELFTRGTFDELGPLAQELDTLENQADEVKETIIEHLSLGTIFPLHRVNLARLISSMDRIANLTTGAASRIAMRRCCLPDHVNKLLVEMASADVDAVKVLQAAAQAMGNDLREAIHLAGEVDKIESRVDDIFDEVFKLMFDLDIDYKAFYQLESIVERLESIADRCSNSAELIRHMALEYLEGD